MRFERRSIAESYALATMPLAALQIIVCEMPSRVLDHQRNAVPFLERQSGSDADQLLSRCVVDQARLRQRTNKQFQNLGIDRIGWLVTAI